MARYLWIKTSPLHPLDRGGDLRTYHMLRMLRNQHHVTFVGMISDDTQRSGIARSREYADETHWVDHHVPAKTSPLFLTGALKNALVGSLPYAVSRFRSQKLCDTVLQLLKSQTYDCIVCDFIFPAASLPFKALHESGAKLILFQHNVESIIWQRRAEQARGITAPYWRAQHRRMEAFEREACVEFDGIIAVSEKDASIMRDQWHLTNVLGHVSTGVDSAFFKEVPRELPAAPRFVFLGSMDWHANVDAVLWFASECWPLVRKVHPNAEFCIVGRQPLPEVKALQSEALGITVTGSVPDVRPWLRGAHAMVVPLRIGGGTRLKILESMAAEVPVISTAIGAEGLPFTHGKELLTAETPAQFAEAMSGLLADPDKATRLAATARDCVEAEHGWQGVADQFTALIDSTDAKS